MLHTPSRNANRQPVHLPESVPNPSLNIDDDSYLHQPVHTENGSGFNNMRLRVPMERRCVRSWLSFSLFCSLKLDRYYANAPEDIVYPPAVQEYNRRFTKALEIIKTRHDPTVTTVAQGVLEWKRSVNQKHIGLDIQAWLDRFYLSRIGIRFLIGQRMSKFSVDLASTPHQCCLDRYRIEHTASSYRLCWNHLHKRG